MVSDNDHDDGSGLNLASSSLFGAHLNCAAAAPTENASPLPSNDNSSYLAQQQPVVARSSVRFDPVAQLLGSDTDDDSTDVVGDSDSEIEDKENSPVGRPSVPLAAAAAAHQEAFTDDEEEEEVVAGQRRRPFSAARFALNKGADSIVARLASSRRSRTAVSDSSEEEEVVVGGPRQRTMSSLRLDSDSDSESAPPPLSLPPVSFNPPPVEPKKPRAPRKNKKAIPTTASEAEAEGEENAGGVPKERPASKAALARMHQETERLVRETAVLINPLDYTQRLVLDDFFARFDLYAANAATGIPDTLVSSSALSQVKPAVLPQHTFNYESDSGDYEIEIVDDDHIEPLSLGPSLLSKPTAAPSSSLDRRGRSSIGTDLDSILEYASQPLRASAPTAVRRPPTDGPTGLRELNDALMRAMYKPDEEALRAAAAAKSVAATATVDQAKNEEDAEETGGSGEDDECSEESDDGDGDDDVVGSDEESELEDIDMVLSPQAKRRPAAIISDDDDTDEVSESKAQQPLVIESSSTDKNKGKAKFLGMFKMPAAKSNTKPVALSPPLQVASIEVEPTPLQQSLAENPISASQDLSHLFHSQSGMVSDTQDSLLMTPVEEIGGTHRQHDSFMDSTQMSSIGHLEPFPDYTITQPTQMMDDADDDDKEEVGRAQIAQATQEQHPTQLTVATGSDAGDSIFPTMVRQALVSAASGSDLGDDSDIADEEVGGSPMSLPRKVPAGRLLRRGDVVAQRKQKRQRPKRSEFVEAEAEVGDSSDSDGEGKPAGPRKFNWGDGPGALKPGNESSDEDEYDMDSEEEEAALLADPMINNEVDENESEGDEAIRELHRQRDFDEDEHNIQTLYKDITTGALKNRVSRNRTGFALADDEDYNDRQTRAERMEERERMRRKLLAREIHDKDLAEIAKNPETAAFARAALMRPPPPPSSSSVPGSSSSGTAVGEQDDDDDGMLVLPGDDFFELEEIVDDRHVAMAVQQQLMRTRMRVDSDDDDDPAPPPPIVRPTARVAGRPMGSSQLSAMTDSLPMDDIDGDAFSSVSVEKLIVRRRTLLATTGKDDSGFAANHRASSLLKRPGTALLGAAAKRLNVAAAASG
ncbi:hypothetical protein GGI21_001516, partial [Coemansia aciculifera]